MLQYDSKPRMVINLVKYLLKISNSLPSLLSYTGNPRGILRIFISNRSVDPE